MNNILIQNKTLTRNFSVAFQIFLFHLQRPVSARLLLVWMFSMCFIYNSVYFSPQESATLEPKCTVKVDEYGFFINWQSAERVSSSSLYKKVVRSLCIIYQLVSSFINVTKKSSKLKKKLNIRYKYEFLMYLKGDKKVIKPICSLLNLLRIISPFPPSPI